MSAAPALRALPARPSLEFERKEAKALLRRLRAGDPDAVARARVRHPRFDAAHARLADAQLHDHAIRAYTRTHVRMRCINKGRAAMAANLETRKSLWICGLRFAICD